MKRTLQTVPRLLLTCSLFLVGCSGTSKPPSAGGDEAPLARGVAEDFLIATGPAGSYPILTDKARPFTTTTFLKNFRQGGGLWYEFKAFSITSQSVNSTQTEATVRGSVQALHSWVGESSTGQEFKDTVGFRIRLKREQGKWLVDGIEYGAAQVDNKK